MISPLVKKIMAARGLKQAQLAEALGVTLDRVKSLTSGKVSKLTQAELRAFVEKLHVRPEFLATGEGEVLRSEEEQAFGDRLALLRDATDTATAMPLPPSYQALTRDIIVGSALRNTDVVRGAIDRFLANEAAARFAVPGEQAADVAAAAEQSAEGRAGKKKPRSATTRGGKTAR